MTTQFKKIKTSLNLLSFTLHAWCSCSLPFPPRGLLPQTTTLTSRPCPGTLLAPSRLRPRLPAHLSLWGPESHPMFRTNSSSASLTVLQLLILLRRPSSFQLAKAPCPHGVTFQDVWLGPRPSAIVTPWQEGNMGFESDRPGFLLFYLLASIFCLVSRFVTSLGKLVKLS